MKFLGQYALLMVISTVWMAANSVLGSSFLLVIPITSPTKSVLKKFKMNKKGRALPFGPEYLGVKTSGGHHFLSGTTPIIPSTKRQKLGNQYECNHQAFINIIVPGNYFGSHCITFFLQNLHLILSVFTHLEPKLVILSYPDCGLSKFRPVQHDTA